MLSHICADYNYSQEIKMNGGVHRCSALSTQLIILKIWCRETIYSRLESAIKVEPDKLVVVASFYYLSDMLSVGRCCEMTARTPDQMACRTFMELLPVLAFRHPSYKVLCPCVEHLRMEHYPSWQ